MDCIAALLKRNFAHSHKIKNIEFKNMALEGENYSKINHIIKDAKELITIQYQEYNSSGKKPESYDTHAYQISSI